MNGLNRSPSASSYERPGGLAQASHAVASMAAMDGTTRAVKLEDMGGQAVRSGGIAHLSTHGAVFVVKASSFAPARIVPSRDPMRPQESSGLAPHRRLEPRPRKALHGDAWNPARCRALQGRRFSSSS
jgi:hypothetical protein